MSGNVIDTFLTRKRDYAKRVAVALGIGLRNISSQPAKIDVKPDQPEYSYSESN
jgi:hypothetical protein